MHGPTLHLRMYLEHIKYSSKAFLVISLKERQWDFKNRSSCEKLSGVFQLMTSVYCLYRLFKSVKNVLLYFMCCFYPLVKEYFYYFSLFFHWRIHCFYSLFTFSLFKFVTAHFVVCSWKYILFKRNIFLKIIFKQF